MAYPREPERGTPRTDSEQARAPTSQGFEPATHTPEQTTAAARPKCATENVSATRQQALYTRQSLFAPDEGKRRARGGTRTTFQALQTLGTRENMRSPGQSGGCWAQYGTKSVDIVHSPLSGALEHYRGIR